MFKIIFAALCLAAVLVSGCAAPQVLVHPQQGMPNLKPASGKATLVVIRKTMFKGSVGTWSLSLDGKELSRLSISSYVVKEIGSGEHYLSNVVFSDAPTAFQAKEGNIYFFNYDLPFFGGAPFDELPESEALDLMEQYTRLKTYF